MLNLWRFSAKVANLLRKMGAGLHPFGEAVWPGVRTDLFVAHESIYFFFASFAAGAQVLDAGCGTGYGCQVLRSAGAERIVGVDYDVRNIRYARRRFGARGVTFEVRDLESLAFPAASFSLAVSSNALEHLHAPRDFLESAHRLLRPDGKMIIVLPPIIDDASLRVNRAIPFHRSNFSIRQWVDLFGECRWDVATYAHRVRRGCRKLDFGSPFASELKPSDFEFEPTTVDDLYGNPPLSGVYVLCNR